MMVEWLVNFLIYCLSLINIFVAHGYTYTEIGCLYVWTTHQVFHSMLKVNGDMDEYHIPQQIYKDNGIRNNIEYHRSYHNYDVKSSVEN